MLKENGPFHMGTFCCPQRIFSCTENVFEDYTKRQKIRFKVKFRYDVETCYDMTIMITMKLL